jgi:hypothetical protein
MKKIFVIFASLLILPLFFASVVSAQSSDKQPKTVVLAKSEVVNKDYFAAGDSVTLSGTVNGDAYLAGGNVIVEGTINGDLLVAGGMVEIRGKISDDVRAAGGQIVISAQIGKNLTVAGGTVNLTDSAKIGGSLAAGTGTLSVFSPIGKDLNIGGGQVTLGNTVGGGVRAGIGKLTLTPNAKISGDLTYWSDAQAQIQSGAEVLGQTTHNLPPAKAPKAKPARILGIFTGVSLALKIASFLWAFVIGLLLLKFFPVYTRRTVETMIKKPWASLGMGFLVLILTPIIFLILLITVLGIPIAFILLVTFLIVAYLAKIFVSILVGQKILRNFGSKAGSNWALLLGLVIYGLVTLIPFIGPVVSLLVVIFGLGAVFLEEKDFHLQLRSKNLI